MKGTIVNSCISYTCINSPTTQQLKAISHNTPLQSNKTSRHKKREKKTSKTKKLKKKPTKRAKIRKREREIKSLAITERPNPPLRVGAPHEALVCKRIYVSACFYSPFAGSASAASSFGTAAFSSTTINILYSL